MIHHWKGLDLDITDFEYHDDPTYTGEIIPSETSRYVIRGFCFIMRNESSIPRAERVKKGEARRAEQ